MVPRRLSLGMTTVRPTRKAGDSCDDDDSERVKEAPLPLVALVLYVPVRMACTEAEELEA